uniref:Uncharacterized protein n=2 Tax=Aegilops tauschii subsp. strangulata TaxID=200361 RepID=A0A453CW51_AEGTS
TWDRWFEKHESIRSNSKPRPRTHPPTHTIQDCPCPGRSETERKRKTTPAATRSPLMESPRDAHLSPSPEAARMLHEMLLRDLREADGPDLPEEQLRSNDQLQQDEVPLPPARID